MVVATESSCQEDRIVLQSEAAENFFRIVELHPVAANE